MISAERQELLPSSGAQDIIDEQIDELKERCQRNFPGTSYAVFWHHRQRRMIAAPPHLILSSPFSHALDYGSGLFEGSSAIMNERTGIPQIILLDPRNDRLFNRSLPARGYQSPVSRTEFRQAQLDFVAINGSDLFQNPDLTSPQKLVRAYIRPTVHPAGLGGYGISLKKDQPIDAAVITWPWPDYLNPKIYTEGGVAAITGEQRLFKITGKHASNYGTASIEGSVARDLGANELIYLAPYLINQNGYIFWANPEDQGKKLFYGTLADGPGEEIVALTADMKTLVYPPMRVNRLGGTVLDYVRLFMAPKLKLETKEKDITLRDLGSNEYAAVGLIGNAVKIAPIRLIELYDKGCRLDAIELFEKGKIPEPLQKLMDRWDQETRGLIDPSHPSLATPVDVAKGQKLRKILDEIFS